MSQTSGPQSESGEHYARHGPSRSVQRGVREARISDGLHDVLHHRFETHRSKSSGPMATKQVIGAFRRCC